jgi:hypothetical protein
VIGEKGEEIEKVTGGQREESEWATGEWRGESERVSWRQEEGGKRAMGVIEMLQ